MDPASGFFASFTQRLKPALAVFVIPKDVTPLIAAEWGQS